jgi:mRNA interferase RelE/StbE
VYKIEFKPAAVRDLRKLSDRMRRAEWEALKTAIDSLAETPRPYGAIKLSGADFYRLRLGDYRIIYAIDDQARRLTVTKVARRSEATYRE